MGRGLLHCTGGREQDHPPQKEMHKGKMFVLEVLTSIEYTKAFDYVDHNKLWKILKEMGIPDHLTLRNLYAGH